MACAPIRAAPTATHTPHAMLERVYDGAASQREARAYLAAGRHTRAERADHELDAISFAEELTSK